MSKIPAAIDHPAMKKRRTNPVTWGQNSVSAPVRMPSTPTSASHQRGEGVSPIMAAPMARPPSNSANTP